MVLPRSAQYKNSSYKYDNYHASALSRYEYGSLDWIGFASRNRHIFRGKAAGAVLGARGELVASCSERGPTGTKFGTLPSSHEAVVQNN